MIDWTKQWEQHAPNFFNGRAHVFLKDYGGPDRSFVMVPGGGFGDLSHPTTGLMLKLMPKKIEHPVIDVGCGSGVLSLAAKLRGAPLVMGIDIEVEAIAHAQKNAKINGLECFFGKSLPERVKEPLILMNMISSEQEIAWNCLPKFEKYTLIASGYPEEEKDPSHLGRILSMEVLEGWKGYICLRT